MSFEFSEQPKFPVKPLKLYPRITGFILDHPNESIRYRDFIPVIPKYELKDKTLAARIHRRFVREILQNEFDLVLCTGATGKIVHETLSIAANMEKRKADKGNNPLPQKMPEFTDWPSSFSYDIYGFGPNAVVYKYFPEAGLQQAITNIRNAKDISEVKRYQ